MRSLLKSAGCIPCSTEPFPLIACFSISVDHLADKNCVHIGFYSSSVEDGKFCLCFQSGHGKYTFGFSRS